MGSAMHVKSIGELWTPVDERQALRQRDGPSVASLSKRFHSLYISQHQPPLTTIHHGRLTLRYPAHHAQSPQTHRRPR